jgi:hypothetical protein
MNRAKVVAAFVFGTVLATAGTAVAVTVSAPDPINACVSKKDGELRILDPGKTCKTRSEDPLSWNVQGPQGLPGLPGTPGPQGSPGPQGEPGTGSGSDYPDQLQFDTNGRTLPGSVGPTPIDPKTWPLVGSGTFPGRGVSSYIGASLQGLFTDTPPSVGSVSCAVFFNGELAGRAIVDTLAIPREEGAEGPTYYAPWRDFELGPVWSSSATIDGNGEGDRDLRISVGRFPANTPLAVEMRCFRVGNDVVIVFGANQGLNSQLPVNSDLQEFFS